MRKAKNAFLAERKFDFWLKAILLNCDFYFVTRINVLFCGPLLIQVNFVKFVFFDGEKIIFKIQYAS